MNFFLVENGFVFTIYLHEKIKVDGIYLHEKIKVDDLGSAIVEDVTVSLL